ncbi:J domain-containing protein [Streptomyces sp. NPDC012794]|uniref:J domain-containing protein n=1 Tax=Streptomyces sp. NPDC012794 TaxID=3364850 RepID=UPI0036C95806
MGGSRVSRDHYAVLGLPAEASPEAITSAYRALIRALHPDARPGGPTAAAELAEVIDAYQTLRDPLRRSAYDAERRQRPHAAGRPVRIPVRVRRTADTAERPYPPPEASPHRVVFHDFSRPYEDPFDRLVSWLFHGI